MQDQPEQIPNPVNQQNNTPPIINAQKPEDPGYIWALIGLIASVVGFAPVGAVLSAIGFAKSKAVGIKNILALWGIIIGVTFSIIGTIILILIAPFIIAPISDVIEKCNELGPGTHKVDGATYTCGARESSNHTEFEYSIGN